MTRTLNLSPDKEERILLEAAQQGLSEDECAIALLLASLNKPPPPMTGAEAVAYWDSQGLFGSRPDIKDSAAHARALRERAQRRERG